MKSPHYLLPPRPAVIACLVGMLLSLCAPPARAQMPPEAALPAVPAVTDAGSPSASASPTPAPLPLSKSIEPPPVPTGEWKRQEYTVARATAPPTIDGKLDDTCWKTATHAVGFYRSGGRAPVTQQTEAWIAADNDNLYIAFHCLDSEPGKIRASETQRGGRLWGDDHVEVDVDSQNMRRGGSSFIVSANGTQAEELEGGTADNITWAGDWRAAVSRTDDGWVAEIAIPFKLLRYPRGARTFGLFLWRRLARETNPEIWPYLPPAGQGGGNNISQYMDDFTGLTPRYYAPRPIFLPFLLATGGDGSGARQGLDIKYPLSTTMTGVAAINPDFKTVEQAVTSVAFSYNERFVPDHRPFFAEGTDFFPDSSLFYSQRIETVDQGFKVAGKNGPTTLGVLYAGNQEPGKKRQSVVVNAQRDFGKFNRLGVAFAGDNPTDLASNRVGRVFGGYGWQQGRWRYDLNGNYSRSQVAGRDTGGMGAVNFRANGGQGKPNLRFGFDGIGASFTSNLGLLPDTNRRGWSAGGFQYNNFDKGTIEEYETGWDMGTYNRQDGTFFNRYVSGYSYVQDRRGRGVEMDVNVGNRMDDPTGTRFDDHTLTGGFYWNQRTLFQGGNISLTGGRQAGQSYQFVSAQQGILIARPFSLNLRYGGQRLGDTRTTQLIVTGTYRLNLQQTISGRLIRQDGSGSDDQTVGAPHGTNFYLAFSQRVRRGADIFLLLGDPNANSTRSQITLKVLRPY